MVAVCDHWACSMAAVAADALLGNVKDMLYDPLITKEWEGTVGALMFTTLDDWLTRNGLALHPGQVTTHLVTPCKPGITRAR